MASSLQAGTVRATPEIIGMQITSIIFIMWWFHWCHHHNYRCHWCPGDNNSIIAFLLHYECSCITQSFTAVVSLHFLSNWYGLASALALAKSGKLYYTLHTIRNLLKDLHIIGDLHKGYIIYSCSYSSQGQLVHSYMMGAQSYSHVTGDYI